MSPTVQRIYGVDASTEPKCSPEATIFKKHSLKRVFAAVRRVCWVRLLTYDAPERTAACLALLPVCNVAVDQ